MARYKEKAEALTLRKKGMSYSAIKEKLGVSKSTLSYWLGDLPLSREQINELRAHSPKRIEKYRNTMRVKREKRMNAVYEVIGQDLNILTKREIFVAGFFLYWGEGGKTKTYSITFSNTDPSMIRFYLRWVKQLGVPDKKVKVRLHLYTDMNIEEKIKFWVKTINVTEEQFTQPYIKSSKASNLKYRGFGHGTCNIIIDNRDVSEYVLQGLKYLSAQF